MRLKLLFVITFIIFTANFSFAGGVKVIAVIKSGEQGPYNDAFSGFKNTLEKEKIKFRVIEYNIRRADSEIQKIESENPDLIFAIGSKALEKISSRIKNIPVLFSMVLHPEKNGYQGKNITGVSLDIPPVLPFKMLKSLIPEAHEIGVLYNPEKTQDVIDAGDSSAKELDLNLTSVTVNSIDELPGAVSYISKKADVLWMVADQTVYTVQSTYNTLLYTLREGLPVIGISAPYVKAGALFSLSCDYSDIGRQSGEMAIKILQGMNPSSIPIAVPEKTGLFLNLKTAKRLGIKIPQEFIKKAKRIYE